MTSASQPPNAVYAMLDYFPDLFNSNHPLLHQIPITRRMRVLAEDMERCISEGQHPQCLPPRGCRRPGGHRLHPKSEVSETFLHVNYDTA